MRLPPSSFLWLLAHDVRLSWRQFTDIFKGWSGLAVYGAVVTGVVVLHLLAFAALKARGQAGSTLSLEVLTTAGIGTLLWMAAQALLAATRQLYERGDLDVLFSSPLPAWKAVASRAIATACTSLGSVVPLMLPLANVGCLIDGPVWLVLYPVMLVLALTGTAAGFLVAVAMVSFLGVRRARFFSQITAAFIAGAFVLGVQIIALLPKAMTHELVAWVELLKDHSLWHGRGVLPLLSDMFEGDLTAVLLVLAGAGTLFAASVYALSGAFQRASSAAAGIATRSPGPAEGRPFTEGTFPSLRRKEWRLLVRDHNVFAQLSLQIIYTLPMAVLLLRSQHNIPAALAIAPLIVVLAAQLSASLAWITVCGEDAPELIATAPMTTRQASLAKLSAVGLPVALLLCIPFAGLAMLHPMAALQALVCAILAGMSTSLLNFWHPMPGNRRGLLRRHSQSKVIALAEHGLALLWATVIVMALINSLALLVPLALIGLVLWMFKPKAVRQRSLGPAFPVPASV